MRLYRQHRQLNKYGSEILYHNIETLDNLEAVKNMESFAAVEAQFIGAANVIN
jgi:hypothetical protein